MTDVFARKTVRCKIHFEQYIAHPYWPARERVIRIELHSGLNRLKNEDKKLAALKSQCDKEGITVKDYHELVKQAARQWYRSKDGPANKDTIIIPRHQLAGCLVECIGRSPKAITGRYDKDSFRHHVLLSDFSTEKTKADGVYDRYVKLEGSNKRDHQQNEYIADFVAEGTLAIPADAKLDELKRLVSHAVQEIGVGASRKMGYGRGKVVYFEEE